MMDKHFSILGANTSKHQDGNTFPFSIFVEKIVEIMTPMPRSFYPLVCCVWICSFKRIGSIASADVEEKCFDESERKLFSSNFFKSSFHIGRNYKATKNLNDWN